MSTQIPAGVEIDAASLFGQNPESVAAGRPIRRREIPANELFVEPEMDPGGNIASDVVSGAVKHIGRTGVGVAELLSRLFDAAGQFQGTATDIEAMKEALTRETGFDETQRALEPKNTAETVGSGLASVGEFAAASAIKTPAAVEAALSRIPGVLGTLRAGADTAGVLAAQEGELPDPRDVGLGMAAGGIGHGIGRAVKALGRKAFQSAPETLAKVLPPRKTDEFSLRKTVDAAGELLDSGEAPVGNIKEIAKALKGRTARLGQEMEAHQSGVVGQREDIRPLIQRLRDEIDARTMQGPGGQAPFDSDETSRLRELVGELEEMATVRGTPATPPGLIYPPTPGKPPVPDYNIERGDLESKLQAWQKVYKQNLDTPGTSRAMTKLGADELLEMLNQTDPTRLTKTGPFSRSLVLTQSARRQAALDPIRQKSGIGEAGAIRTGVGALAGGALGGAAGGVGGASAGATLGALSVPLIVRFLRSPLYLSFSAREKSRIGRFLMNTNPDNARAAFSALGIEVAPEGVEE